MFVLFSLEHLKPTLEKNNGTKMKEVLIQCLRDKTMEYLIAVICTRASLWMIPIKIGKTL